jgi:2Fe-2S ferredoxin
MILDYFSTQPEGDVCMLKLKNGKKEYLVEPQLDQTIFKIVSEKKIPWGFLCEQGNCARCRTLVVEGYSHLNEPTKEEERRLMSEELEKGYRLGCQLKVVNKGEVTLQFAPYF